LGETQNLLIAVDSCWSLPFKAVLEEDLQPKQGLPSSETLRFLRDSPSNEQRL
jgi:hypothetical protein